MRCFYLEATDKCRRSLRRYRSTSKTEASCTASPNYATHPQYAYHNAQTPIEDGYAGKKESEWGLRWDIGPKDEESNHDDPRWPKQCACGYEFEPDDQWQVFTDVIYRRTDTGQEMTLREAGPGAMWNAWWLVDMYAPTVDGRVLMVKCPNGEDWCIDGRASNCTMPQDRVHHCWVRHGEPPNITVDKNGFTCQAGAGSIIAGNYHGFLRNGEFTPPL